MLEGARDVARVMEYSTESSLLGSPTLHIYPALSNLDDLSSKHEGTKWLAVILPFQCQFVSKDSMLEAVQQ